MLPAWWQRTQKWTKHKKFSMPCMPVGQNLKKSRPDTTQAPSEASPKFRHCERSSTGGGRCELKLPDDRWLLKDLEHPVRSPPVYSAARTSDNSLAGNSGRSARAATKRAKGGMFPRPRVCASAPPGGCHSPDM